MMMVYFVRLYENIDVRPKWVAPKYPGDSSSTEYGMLTFCAPDAGCVLNGEDDAGAEVMFDGTSSKWSAVLSAGAVVVSLIHVPLIHIAPRSPSLRSPTLSRDLVTGYGEALGTPTRSIESGADVPLSAGGAVTIFDDEFSGNTLSSSWSAAFGSNPNNRERECYQPRNVSVSGGFLNETAVVGRSCGADCPPTSTVVCPFTSGGVQWTNFSFTYGTVTVRAKFAGGIGAWPAIWLLGSDCQQPNWLTSTCDWPSPGSNEIDIAEILGSNDRRVNQSLHTEDSYGSVVLSKCEPLVSAANRQWHTYSLTWAPESLTWRIDGVQTCQTTTLIPTTPMFLIINTAVGGVGVGRVKASTLPQTTEIDYVRVTQP
jgi:hypothetical protein